MPSLAVGLVATVDLRTGQFFFHKPAGLVALAIWFDHVKTVHMYMGMWYNIISTRVTQEYRGVLEIRGILQIRVKRASPF
jgi:hypothetical protein